MKHIFIINPIAGRGSGKKTAAIIKEYCEKHEINHEIVYSEHHQHAKEIASRYYINDDVCLYAVGGDGTVNEVLNGLNDQVQMAIIPSGSGNDFFGSLWEKSFDLKNLIAETINGVNVAVDYGVANNFRFVNIVSIGFDAEINYEVNHKNRNNPLIPTKLLYYYTALAMIRKPKPFNVKYYIDGKEYQNICLLIAIANGVRYGGGFNPAPMAKINDGVLDVCAIDFIKSSKILKLLPLYRAGKHVGYDVVKFIQGSEIKIVNDQVMNVNVDGEVITDKELTIRLQKGMLNLRVPIRVKEKMDNENTISQS